MSEFNQQSLWDGYEGNYSGDIIAGEVLRFCRKHVGNKAIDIGGGSGSLVRAFRARFGSGRTIVGIDYAPKSSDVERGDATNLRFGENEFDTIFLLDVIEHLTDSDLRKCFAEIRRVLRVGGCLILTSPNSEDLKQNIVTCPECKCRFHRWGHQRSFSAADLIMLLGSKGFQVDQCLETNLVAYAKGGWPARLAFAIRADRIGLLRGLPWHVDLLVVARKSSP